MTPNDKNSQVDEFNFVECIATALERSTANDSPSTPAINATILELQKLDNSPELVQKDLDCTVLKSRARLNQGRKERMLRIFRLSGLAAMAMILLAGIAFIALSNRNTAIAFEQGVSKVKSAKSFSFTMTQSVPTPEGKDRTFFDKFYCQDNCFRQDKFVQLANGEKELTIRELCDGNTLLKIQYSKKIVTKSARDAAKPKKDEKMVAQDFSEWFTTLTGKNAVRIGEEKLNGKQTQLFRLTKFQMNGRDELDSEESVKVWLDAETGFPVQLRLDIRLPENINKPGKTRIVTVMYENFQWNLPFNQEFFSLEIPESFNVTEEKRNDSHSLSPPFLEIRESIVKAKSVSFTQKMECNWNNGFRSSHYIAGDLERTEDSRFVNTVTILNTKTDEATHINPVDKTFFKSKIVRSSDHQNENMIERLTSMTKLKNTERIGEETLDGKKTILYHVREEELNKDGEDSLAKIWVEPATNLPIKMVFTRLFPDPVDPSAAKQENQKLTMTVEKFNWNVPLKQELFQVPAGYKEIEVPKPVLPKEAQNAISKGLPETEPYSIAKESPSPTPLIETNGSIVIEVVDENGKPIEDVSIVANFTANEPERLQPARQGPYGKTPTKDEKPIWVANLDTPNSKLEHISNSSGRVTLILPNKLFLLSVNAWKGHYVPNLAFWGPETKGERKLPKSFQIKLQRGTRIGGIIQDEQGHPVRGAQIEMQWLNDSIPEEQQQATLASMMLDEKNKNDCITDAEGRWSLDRFPAGDKFKSRLRWTVSHKDFPGEKTWQEVSVDQLANLRAEKTTYVLKKKAAGKSNELQPMDNK